MSWAQRSRPCSNCHTENGERVGWFTLRYVCKDCRERAVDGATLDGRIISIAAIIVSISISTIAALCARPPVSPTLHTPPTITDPAESEQPVIDMRDASERGARPDNPPKEGTVSPQRLLVDHKRASHSAAIDVTPSHGEPASNELRMSAPRFVEGAETTTTRAVAVQQEDALMNVPTTTFGTQSTVIAVARPAEPLLGLRLPQTPASARSYLSGRCVSLQIEIDATGIATAKLLDTGGAEQFFVEAAKRDATQRWRPALDSDGQRVSDTQTVKYCWR